MTVHLPTVILCWASSLAVLVGGVSLICALGQYGPTEFDLAGLALAHALRTEMLDDFMSFVTWFGSLAVLLPLTALLARHLHCRKQRREATFILLSLLGAAVLGHLSKLVFLRPRPSLFPVWTAMPVDYSYPSAHAMQIAAVAMALSLLLANRHVLLSVLLGLVVLLVGVSRLYLQVHFPSDIIAGVLAAAFWVAGLFALMFGRNAGHDKLKSDEAQE